MIVWWETWDQLASRHAQLTRCFSAVAELLDRSGTDLISVIILLSDVLVLVLLLLGATSSK